MRFLMFPFAFPGRNAREGPSANSSSRPFPAIAMAGWKGIRGGAKSEEDPGSSLSGIQSEISMVEGCPMHVEDTLLSLIGASMVLSSQGPELSGDLMLSSSEGELVDGEVAGGELIGERLLSGSALIAGDLVSVS